MKDSDYNLLEIEFRRYGIGKTLKYYDKLKSDEAIYEKEDTMLNKDYRIVLDAVIEEYNEKKDKVQDLKSENVLKRIPPKKGIRMYIKTFYLFLAI